MELLDRYLQAVKKHLPWERQDDIIAELKANLESQLEDKEAELGRPLTKDEMDAWLKQIGSPMQVAGRYLPQRYLIGPAVFPMYLYVLKLACFWCFVIYSIVSAMQIFNGGIANGTELAGAALRVPAVLMTTAAWVTLIFAAIEFRLARNPSKRGPLANAPFDWSPGALPPVVTTAGAGKRPRSFAMAVTEVTFGYLLLAWLLLIPAHPWLLLGPGALSFHASPYQLAPVWIQFYWWAVAVNVLQLGWRTVDLLRGRWQRPQPVQRIVLRAIGLIPAFVLLLAPGHIYGTIAPGRTDHALLGAPLTSINETIYKVLLLICAIAVLQLMWGIGRLSIGVYRKRAAATR
jgi:hypothetical protein